MKKYEKLVRDRIPEIIERDGKKCTYKIASKEERYKMLEDKLQEEVGEFLQDKNLEELADVMEVVMALSRELGYSEEELMRKREGKRMERGGFEEGIVLKEVRD